MSKNLKLTIIPVMLCFFAMGFVDLVGIASNYVKEDLNLTDTVANVFPSLVFFWFLIFSVPTGVLMNKIGRKKTVMLSLIVTVVSLLLPIFKFLIWYIWIKQYLSFMPSPSFINWRIRHIITIYSYQHLIII